MKNLKHLLFIFSLAIFFSHCVNTTPPTPVSTEQSAQWYCSTIDNPATDPVDTAGGQQRAVAFKNKFWPVGYTFKVLLLNPNAQQTIMFKQACAEWEKIANVKFNLVTTKPADLRVSFNSTGGAWSYVGTDIKSVGQDYATMNLGWLALDAYLHELGHTLNLLHEHQNPTSPIKWNEPQVIKDLKGPPNNWSLDMIKFNVLNPYPLPNVITTALDKSSIMMYPIPSTWTLDGFSSPGGEKISDVDKDFIAKQYPFSEPPITGNITLRKGQVDTLLMQYNLMLTAFNQTTVELGKSNDLMKKYLGRLK